MSVVELKARVADVPNTITSPWGSKGGRIVLQWGDGFAASVDAAASDADCEAAIRNAAKLPPVMAIPEKPTASVLPVWADDSRWRPRVVKKLERWNVPSEHSNAG